jgi:hypothetical protein
VEVTSQVWNRVSESRVTATLVWSTCNDMRDLLSVQVPNRSEEVHYEVWDRVLEPRVTREANHPLALRSIALWHYVYTSALLFVTLRYSPWSHENRYCVLKQPSLAQYISDHIPLRHYREVSILSPPFFK